MGEKLYNHLILKTMKKIQYSILVGLCLLCFASFALMIRGCDSLNMFTFTFLWVCMCVSALTALAMLKAMEDKV